MDAATGFANNEPVQLELEGIDTVVLHVDDVIALPGPGLIAGTDTLDGQGDASPGSSPRPSGDGRDRRGSRVGLDAAIAAVPELAADRDDAGGDPGCHDRHLVAAGGGGDFGAIDREGWEASIAYLTTLGLVPNPVTVERPRAAGTSCSTALSERRHTPAMAMRRFLAAGAA